MKFSIIYAKITGQYDNIAFEPIVWLSGRLALNMQLVDVNWLAQ